MPRIKVIFVEDYNGDDYGNYDSRIVDSTTSWEDVSEEDYQFLRNNMHMVLAEFTKGYSSVRPVLIREDEMSVARRIESVKEALERQKAKREADAAALKKKQDDAAKKRKKKAEERERRDFERLKAKFENGKAAG